MKTVKLSWGEMNPQKLSYEITNILEDKEDISFPEEKDLIEFLTECFSTPDSNTPPKVWNDSMRKDPFSPSVWFSTLVSRPDLKYKLWKVESIWNEDEFPSLSILISEGDSSLWMKEQGIDHLF